MFVCCLNVSWHFICRLQRAQVFFEKERPHLFNMELYGFILLKVTLLFIRFSKEAFVKYKIKIHSGEKGRPVVSRPVCPMHGNIFLIDPLPIQRSYLSCDTGFFMTGILMRPTNKSLYLLINWLMLIMKPPLS